MLYELNVTQKDGDSYRRWFMDDYFELITWYSADKTTIKGFQLCYDRNHDEHAVTWMNNGFKHDKVDDGKKPFKHAGSPILVDDGIFPVKQILNKFKKACEKIDYQVANFVIEKLNTYPTK